MEANTQAIYRLRQEVHLWSAKAAKAEEDRAALWARVNEAQEEQQYRLVVIAVILLATVCVLIFAGAALVWEEAPSGLRILGILILSGCWVGVVWACLRFALRRTRR